MSFVLIFFFPLILFFFFSLYGDHRYLHVLTHSFPTRRSSDLVSIGQWHHVSWLALSRPPVLSAHHKSRTPELRSLGLLPSSPADRPAGGTGATASLRYERNRRKTAHAENPYPDIILRGPPGPCRRRGRVFGQPRRSEERRVGTECVSTCRIRR